MFSRLITMLALFSLPTLAVSQDARLDLPSFKHLQGKAVECVDITIGKWPLGIAAAFIREDDSKDAAEVKELLRGLKAIYIRSYKFDADNGYSKRDIDEVRRQLKSPMWTQLAQVHSNKEGSDLDVYIAMDGEQPTGLALIASEPREFTILNVVGKINPKNLGRLEQHFGLPSLAIDTYDATSEQIH